MLKLNSTEEGTVYRFLVGGQAVFRVVPNDGSGEDYVPPDSLGITMDKANYEMVMEQLSKYKEDFDNGKAARVTVFFPGVGHTHAAKIPRSFQTGETPTGFIAPILTDEEKIRIIDSMNTVVDAVKNLPDAPSRCPTCTRILAQHFDGGIIVDYCVNGCKL